MADSLGINLISAKELSKSQLKKKVKEQINERMYNMVQQKLFSAKKLWFVQDDGQFRRKDYVLKSSGSEAIKTLRTRLNMIPIYGNFKGDVLLNRHCALQ